MSDPPETTTPTLDRAALERRLESIRERTLSLIAVVDWTTLRRQHTPILSPMVWDLGHIGNFEELWIGERLGRLRPPEEDYGRIFDAVLNPRATRDRLPLPEGSQLFRYLNAVRERTLETLAKIDPAAERQLLEHGLVFEMVAQHEEQHQETLLQAMQILDNPAYVPPQRRRLPAPRPVSGEMVPVPAGAFLMGWGGAGFAYDNEKQRHEVHLGDFLIDRVPVTNGDFLAFVDEGGYRREEFWSRPGWRWRQESGAEHPANWRPAEGGWEARYMDRIVPLPMSKPVVHVCFWEAQAYARFVGKRLPTEAEWEKAALWDPDARVTRSYPWGDAQPSAERANLDQLGFEPCEVGAFPAGASAYGAEQMVGDVWEWTSSEFRPYPGFRAFPYPEYSEIFFGTDYRVLRGGSWATRPAVARGTFRNWDYPIRRQIFAGFRCARDG